MDLVISFDTTGSMYPCLTEVRRTVEMAIQTLFSTIPNLRVGLIAHGDYCDKERVITQIDLTTDQAKLCAFVRTVLPTDGGDSDECYELVLNTMRSMSWESEKRVCILFGDAMPHSRGYIYFDHDALESYKVLDWREEAQSLHNEGVTIYPVHCLSWRSYAESFYKSLATMNSVPYVTLDQFSQVIPAINALAFAQSGHLQQYADSLQAEGLIDRSMANMLDQLLGAKDSRYGSAIVSSIVTTGVKGFEPVHPSRFQRLLVDSTMSIRDFVQYRGAVYKIGKGFYELTKREEIQPFKEVVLLDRTSGDMYTGDKARDYIGVPYGTRGYAYPPKDNTYTVFVQSTSVNRKLMRGTNFLYEVS